MTKKTDSISGKIAFFPGSFDPMTNGHLALLSGALHLADRVVVGIGVHSSKTPFFSYDQRADLIKQTLADLGKDIAQRVTVMSFDNLVVDAARQAGASILVRGLRDASDFAYEMQMAGMNGAMDSAIQTVFLPSTPDTRPITATLVRQIATMGGDVSPFVPKPVLAAIKAKVSAG